ncbi:MAG: LamG-like jellyroll fold domain-containing protein [Chitinispirillaceae bacterium]
MGFAVLKRGIVAALVCASMFYCTNPSGVSDSTPPVINLQSKADTVYLANPWEAPRISATDDEDGDLSSSVRLKGEVNTYRIGAYPLAVSVSDEAGNRALDTLTVHVVTDPSIIAWYPFHGNVKDYSGSGFHGTEVGSPVMTDDRFGNENSAYSFDGSSHISVDYATDLDFVSPFSISVWAKSEVPGADYTTDAFIIDLGFGAERDYAIFYSPSNGLCFRYAGKNCSNDTVNIGEWHHYALVFTGDELQGFIDGEQVGSVETGPLDNDDDPLRIGSQSKKVERLWKGTIDDVVIYDIALTGEQVENLSSADALVPDTTVDPGTGPGDPGTGPGDPPEVVTGLEATVTGTSGNLRLTLTWDEVPSALGYGIYFNPGTTVSRNDYYRVSVGNSRTFTTELTEGETYTFAVTFNTGNSESPFSEPVTVLFEAP